jgi:hypothetical protein
MINKRIMVRAATLIRSSSPPEENMLLESKTDTIYSW